MMYRLRWNSGQLTMDHSALSYNKILLLLKLQVGQRSTAVFPFTARCFQQCLRRSLWVLHGSGRGAITIWCVKMVNPLLSSNPFCSRVFFSVGFGYLNTEPHRVFGVGNGDEITHSPSLWDARRDFLWVFRCVFFPKMGLLRGNDRHSTTKAFAKSNFPGTFFFDGVGVECFIEAWWEILHGFKTWLFHVISRRMKNNASCQGNMAKRLDRWIVWVLIVLSIHNQCHLFCFGRRR